MIVVGGGAQDAGESIAELAELLQAPVTTRRMGHGTIPTAHPLFAHLAIGHALWKDADVVIGIGSRLEWPLMFWGVDEGKTIVKIDIDPDELDRHALDTIGVCGDADDVCRALIAALEGMPRSAGPHGGDRPPARRLLRRHRPPPPAARLPRPRCATCCPTTGSSSRT